MREKPSHCDGKSHRQKSYIASQFRTRFYAIVAEAAAIDLQAPQGGVRQGNHEHDEQGADDEPGPSYACSNDQHRAEREFHPRQNPRHPLDDSERQHLVGIDSHGEEEIVIPQVPCAGKVQLGVRRIYENQTEQYSTGDQQKPRLARRAGPLDDNRAGLAHWLSAVATDNRYIASAANN